MLATDRLIKELNDILTHHVISTKNLTKANLNDQAVLSEIFCAEFFSVLLGVSLKSANSTKSNVDSIDLFDQEARLAIQVTFREDREKVEATLLSFLEHDRFKDFDRLYIAIFGNKTKYRKPFDIDARIAFDEKEHVLSLPQMIQLASTLPLESLQSLVRIANQYLPIHRGIEKTWGKVGIDFAILNRQVEFPWSTGSDNALQRLSYRYENVADLMIVTPQLPYLDLLERGEPLPGLRYWDTPFIWDYPNLDVKVVNRSESPVYISEGNFLVSQSKPDLRPIPVFSYSTFDMHLSLRNAGWGVMRNTRLAFNLIPIVGQPREIKNLSFGTYKFSKNIGDIGDISSIDLGEFFQELGVDVAFLRARWEEISEGSELFVATGYPGLTINVEQFQDRKQLSLGPFFLYRPDPNSLGVTMSAQGAAQVFGELTYSYEFDGEAGASSVRELSVRFSTVIWVSETRPSAPRTPSFQYELELPSFGKDYQAQLSLNQVIASGETDRFNIRVAANRSSFHDFALQLKEAGGEILVTKRVRLHMIVTKLPSPPPPPPPPQNPRMSKPGLLLGSGKRALF